MTCAVETILRWAPNWLQRTTERYRVDEHALDQLAGTESVLPAKVASLLPRCDAWLKTVLFNRHSPAHLRITQHLLQRADEYLGKPSRCGTYVELLDDERQLIERLSQIITPACSYKIVELGLNDRGDVCKIALLLPFDQWLPDTQRKLFLLVGCDGGVKSFYVVPNIKWRKRYQMSAEIRALSFHALVEFGRVSRLEGSRI